MHEATSFLIRHGYAVLFLCVLAEQLGLPLPAVPVLLAAGALAGLGQFHPAVVILLAVGASLVSDFFWYELGRRRGSRILNLLCRVSLEPDSCVRKTENVFALHGARSLIVAKFVPGLNTAAPPLAGVIRMSPLRFLFFDTLGAVLWAGTFVGLGYLFSDALEEMGGALIRLGGSLGILVGTAFAAYVLWKYYNRRRFLRELRIARIAPEAVKRMVDEEERMLILDLRHSLDMESDPYSIPGALHMGAEELEARHAEIPRDRDVILYCT